MTFQENEITEYHIYNKLARNIGSTENRQITEGIAEDELRHYQEWKTHTQQEVKPRHFIIWAYYLVSSIFGLTFGVKLMEKSEEDGQNDYQEITKYLPEAKDILQEEIEHEEVLLNLLDEEKIRYIGSIVLGLNDALVELTGVLASLTLVLQDTKLIALTESITGIAAAQTMGASEYLSTKTEETNKNPTLASIYTGGAYILIVLILILPYLLLTNYYVCLVCSLDAAVIIIGLFNYYIAVAKAEPFKNRFLEMAGLSFGVAAFSFLVGYLMRVFLGVDV